MKELTTYTGLCGELEHLKIKTRLIDERFVSVMGECVIVTLGPSSVFKVIRSTVVFEKILTIFPLTGRLRKLNFRRYGKIGQFPDEPVRIEVVQIHYVVSQTY
jgi:hypothetical protein